MLASRGNANWHAGGSGKEICPWSPLIYYHPARELGSVTSDPPVGSNPSSSRAMGSLNETAEGAATGLGGSDVVSQPPETTLPTKVDRIQTCSGEPTWLLPTEKLVKMLQGWLRQRLRYKAKANQQGLPTKTLLFFFVGSEIHFPNIFHPTKRNKNM